ncbi:MAG: FAD-dependent oxidoreductase [Eubacteriales bacterium]
MIKINQIKLKIDHSEEEILSSILRALSIRKEEIIEWHIDKQSIDARKKPQIYYIYSVSVTVANENQLLKRLKNPNIQHIQPKVYDFKPSGTKKLEMSPVVIGSGPAGLFCTLELAKQGYRPILLERGASVEERLNDVENFWKTGDLNIESNVQFGEGGAGTFSDGKLNTGVKDPFGRNKRVLETLVAYGAPKSILYDSKPHIGTDILVDVVRNMRNHMIELGATVRFHAKVTGLNIENNQLCGLIINDKEELKTAIAVLAIGHSARDTFTYLYEHKVPMEPKSFAIGVRVEHNQSLIDAAQYGEGHSKKLPASPYKLTANLSSGRGVYSFCMCPGGWVVNASSETGLLAVNGMSYSKRDSGNANSAIVVTVNPSDYQRNSTTNTPLDGMYYQQDLEEKAFQLGKGNIPIQLFGDFCKNIATEDVKTIIPRMKGEYFTTNVRQILPSFIGDSIQEGMEVFGRKIKGFSHPDVVLSGVESRTSSPVRILRNQLFESDIRGLYPCGEGAGYAGGITSAAIDGIKVYEAIASRYKLTN